MVPGEQRALGPLDHVDGRVQFEPVHLHPHVEIDETRGRAGRWRSARGPSTLAAPPLAVSPHSATELVGQRCGTGGRGWPGPGTRSGRSAASARLSRASNSAWSGTHCNEALANTTSTSSSGVVVLEVAPFEAEPVVRLVRDEGSGPLEHRFGIVDPDGVSRPQLLVQRQRQLAWSAPEIDHAASGHRVEPGHQIVEGPATLGREALVLVGIPRRRAHGSDARPTVSLVSRQVQYK